MAVNSSAPVSGAVTVKRTEAPTVQNFIANGKQLKNAVNELSSQANSSGNKALTMLMDELMRKHTTFYNLRSKQAAANGALYTPAGQRAGKIKDGDQIVFTGGNLTAKSAEAAMKKVADKIKETGTGAVSDKDAAMLKQLLDVLSQKTELGKKAGQPTMSEKDKLTLVNQFKQQFGKQIDDPKTVRENNAIDGKNAVIMAGKEALGNIKHGPLNQFLTWLNTAPENIRGRQLSEGALKAKLDEITAQHQGGQPVVTIDGKTVDYNDSMKKDDIKNLPAALAGIATAKGMTLPENAAEMIQNALLK